MRLTSGVTSLATTAYWLFALLSVAPSSISLTSVSTEAMSRATAAEPVAPTGLPSIWWQTSSFSPLHLIGVNSVAACGLAMML